MSVTAILGFVALAVLATPAVGQTPTRSWHDLPVWPHGKHMDFTGGNKGCLAPWPEPPEEWLSKVICLDGQGYRLTSGEDCKDGGTCS